MGYLELTGEQEKKYGHLLGMENLKKIGHVFYQTGLLIEVQFDSGPSFEVGSVIFKATYRIVTDQTEIDEYFEKVNDISQSGNEIIEDGEQFSVF